MLVAWGVLRLLGRGGSFDFASRYVVDWRGFFLSVSGASKSSGFA
jgi:hypothetical protein